MLSTSNSTNGNGHQAAPGSRINADAPPFHEPHTKSIPLALAQPVVIAGAAEETAKTREVYFAGERGEEVRDYTILYHRDGSVAASFVYFYGPDLRAAGAHRGLPLTRKAVYRGRVNPVRLHAATKIKDIFYAGAAGRERRDRQICYHSGGGAAWTSVYFYDGELRAEHASAGSPLRRVVAYCGSGSQS